ncbi:hypothetical protein HPB47_026928 [Ixodes persulcatus]|uniref:Uncharacterized protein n=1 Tax=Ixodes persulcatus TaxID=34615 RepID=A0AC60PXA7_IXOPE|nr:hypothetical protein HPB47_026928 [Ixodes persulcatus]
MDASPSECMTPSIEKSIIQHTPSSSPDSSVRSVSAQHLPVSAATHPNDLGIYVGKSCSNDLLSNPNVLSSLIAVYVCKARVASWYTSASLCPPELQAIFGWMAPATGHSRRMCRILRSEWWQQVRFFRDCLRIACSRQPQQPGTNHRFQDWSRTSIQLTEFLWNQVRPNLPSKKKQRVKEGTVLVLGDRPVAEQHRQILKLGPKFCFEPALKRVDKLALSRLVSRQVPEEDKPRVGESLAAQVGRLEDAGFPESVIASAAEAIVKSIKVAANEYDFDKTVKAFVDKMSEDNKQPVSWHDVYGKHPHLKTKAKYRRMHVTLHDPEFKYGDVKTVSNTTRVMHNKCFTNLEANKTRTVVVQALLQRNTTFEWKKSKPFKSGEIVHNAQEIAVPPMTAVCAKWTETTLEIEAPWTADLVDGHWLWFYPVGHLTKVDPSLKKVKDGVAVETAGTFVGYGGTNIEMRLQQVPASDAPPNAMQLVGDRTVYGQSAPGADEDSEEEDD